MQYINFEEVANYYQDKIEKAVYSLQEDDRIPKDTADEKAFKFLFFVNQGDYHNAVKQANSAVDRKRPEIPVLIKNIGGLQDSSSAIDVYVQKVEIDVYGWCDRTDELKNQWADIELIFSTLCADLKGITSQLNGDTIKLEVSDYPALVEIENRHFVCTVVSNMYIMFNAQLSNMDKIKINNEEIPYITFEESLQTEVLTDQRKQDMIKYLPNHSVYGLALSGLYVKDNSVVNLMVNGCTTGDLYAQPFKVEIIRDGRIIASRNMWIQEFRTARSYGSIVAYSARFVPSYVEV